MAATTRTRKGRKATKAGASWRTWPDCTFTEAIKTPEGIQFDIVYSTGTRQRYRGGKLYDLPATN
jgi:hypothetical protein